MEGPAATKRMSAKRKSSNMLKGPLTPQRFRKAFQDYCALHGRESKLVVEASGVHVDLAQLYQAVIAKGGHEAVSSSKLWGGVLASQPVPGEQLHKLYQSHLQGFAQHHAHGPDPSQLIRSLRSRKSEAVPAADSSPRVSAASQPAEVVQSDAHVRATVSPGPGAAPAAAPPATQTTEKQPAAAAVPAAKHQRLSGQSLRASSRLAASQPEQQEKQSSTPRADAKPAAAEQKPAKAAAKGKLGQASSGRAAPAPAAVQVKQEDTDGAGLQIRGSVKLKASSAAAMDEGEATEMHDGISFIAATGFPHKPVLVIGRPRTPTSPLKRSLRPSTLKKKEEPPAEPTKAAQKAATPKPQNPPQKPEAASVKQKQKQEQQSERSERSEGQGSEVHNGTAYICPQSNVDSPPAVTTASRRSSSSRIAAIAGKHRAEAAGSRSEALGPSGRGRGLSSRGRGREAVLSARGGWRGRGRVPGITPEGREGTFSSSAVRGARGFPPGRFGRGRGRLAGLSSKLLPHGAGKPATARGALSSISYIGPMVSGMDARPPVAVAAAAPSMAPLITEKQREALRRVVQFLRQEAAQGGAGVPDASRFLKGATLRARDTRVLEPTAELITFRRSSRVRTAPLIFAPQQKSSKRPREPVDTTELTDTREGEQFQAQLPELRPKPKRPTPGEGRFLQPPLLLAGSHGPADQPAPIATHPLGPNTCSRCHVVWAHGAKAPGLVPAPLAASLGLQAMGLADASDWSTAELAIYDRAMDEYHRPWGPGFKGLLPGKTQERAAALYYNAWKKQVIPQARAWFDRQERERQEAAAADLARRAAAKAEAKAEAARRVAEASRKAAAAAAAQQVVLQRTRHRQQLREAVMWLRMQARCPTESRLEQQQLQSIATKAGQSLATANCWQLQAPSAPTAAQPPSSHPRKKSHSLRAQSPRRVPHRTGNQAAVPFPAKQPQASSTKLPAKPQLKPVATQQQLAGSLPAASGGRGQPSASLGGFSAPSSQPSFGAQPSFSLPPVELQPRWSGQMLLGQLPQFHHQQQQQQQQPNAQQQNAQQWMHQQLSGMTQQQLNQHFSYPPMYGPVFGAAQQVQAPAFTFFQAAMSQQQMSQQQPVPGVSQQAAVQGSQQAPSASQQMQMQAQQQLLNQQYHNMTARSIPSGTMTQQAPGMTQQCPSMTQQQMASMGLNMQTQQNGLQASQQQYGGPYMAVGQPVQQMNVASKPQS